MKIKFSVFASGACLMNLPRKADKRPFPDHGNTGRAENIFRKNCLQKKIEKKGLTGFAKWI